MRFLNFENGKTKPSIIRQDIVKYIHIPHLGSQSAVVSVALQT